MRWKLGEELTGKALFLHHTCHSCICQLSSLLDFSSLKRRSLSAGLPIVPHPPPKSRVNIWWINESRLEMASLGILKRGR